MHIICEYRTSHRDRMNLAHPFKGGNGNIPIIKPSHRDGMSQEKYNRLGSHPAGRNLFGGLFPDIQGFFKLVLGAPSNILFQWQYD